jgi:hypothetical protein
MQDLVSEYIYNDVLYFVCEFGVYKIDGTDADGNVMMELISFNPDLDLQGLSGPECERIK